MITNNDFKLTEAIGSNHKICLSDEPEPLTLESSVSLDWLLAIANP